MTKERDLMKTQVLKLEQELDKSKALTVSLRDERDSWRKKVGDLLHIAGLHFRNDEAL